MLLERDCKQYRHRHATRRAVVNILRAYVPFLFVLPESPCERAATDRPSVRATPSRRGVVVRREHGKEILFGQRGVWWRQIDHPPPADGNLSSDLICTVTV